MWDSRSRRIPPDRLSATEPPEDRGLQRDEVRLLAADGDRILHRRFHDSHTADGLPRCQRSGNKAVAGGNLETERAAAATSARPADHLRIHARTLETVADPGGSVSSGHGWTHLILGPDRPVRVVDGLITGWHAPGASHLLLLEAVAGVDLVSAAHQRTILAGTCGTSSETAPCCCPTGRKALPGGRIVQRAHF